MDMRQEKFGASADAAELKQIATDLDADYDTLDLEFRKFMRDTVGGIAKMK